MKVKEGQRVFWDDPDGGVCSGIGKVVRLRGDSVYLALEDGGEVECPKSELIDVAEKGALRCNRTACMRVFDDRLRWWNTSIRAWYCQGCALRINRACVDQGDLAICFPETEVSNLPKEQRP